MLFVALALGLNDHRLTRDIFDRSSMPLTTRCMMRCVGTFQRTPQGIIVNRTFRGSKGTSAGAWRLFFLAANAIQQSHSLGMFWFQLQHQPILLNRLVGVTGQPVSVA